MDPVTAEIVTYYERRYEEATRLDRRPQARLERIRTLELLRDLLPDPPARILDVGGGLGAYARELPEPGGSQDATPVLGPLYHLHERADRVRTIREAIRVTRPGGPVVAAAIARFAGAIDFAATARFDERALAEAHRLTTDGVNDPETGFTHAYFHRVSELLDECREAGPRHVVIHGVEGPAWPAAEAAASGPSSDAVFDAALQLARAYSREPELVGVSAHLLAVGTTPRG